MATTTAPTVSATAADTGAMDELWGDSSSRMGTDDPRLCRFLDEKYAMFIHWGLYSLLGGQWQGRTYYGIGEWIMSGAMAGIPVDEYKALAREFNPTQFDAPALVRLAKNAGMRCIVITAKHHEGFAMFDSSVSDFTITRAAVFGRDPLRELADACRAEGIRLGFYYSQNQDWTEPDGAGSRCPPADRSPDFDRYFDGKVIPQVTELLTRYGPIAVVWFDTPGRMPGSYSQRLVDLVHELQPECLVNSRVGNGLGDYSGLGDMQLPTKTPDDGNVYECIDTINDSWAYAHYDKHWKSPATIARSLVRVAARGCRFMLNIGPAGDGSIPEAAARGLSEAGKWIRVHGDAIYGTDASPFEPFAWGDCTVSGRHLYVHVFDWPRCGELQLAALANRVEKAELMGSGDALSFTQDGDVLTLGLPARAPDPIITTLRLTLDGVPRALHSDLTVDGQYPAHLRAEYAATDGVSLTQTRWMETFGAWHDAQNLAEWRGPEDQATWRINVLRAGDYVVEVEYACTPEAEGSEWQLESATDRLAFVALDSGQRSATETTPRRRMRYRTVEQGVIRFDRPGRQQLRFSPLGPVESEGMWVTQIVLKPWGDL